MEHSPERGFPKFCDFLRILLREYGKITKIFFVVVNFDLKFDPVNLNNEKWPSLS